MAPAASQFGQTAGDNRRSWGGRHLNETTDGEEARGRERDARAGKVVVDPDTLPTNGRVFSWSSRSPSPRSFPLASDPLDH